jgi:arginase
VTTIGVPYFLTRYQPGVDLVVPLDVVVRAELVVEAGWSPILPLYESVAAAVSDVIAGGGRPIVMSGDCTVALGTVAGLQRAGHDPGIVWFDAHGDVQTMETTTSGFLGGMPLRILVGYRPELVAAPLGLRATAEERVVLVDARDLDPPEQDYLCQATMRHLPLEDLSPHALPKGPLYVHLDLDIVDPTELPHVRYPAPGGPSLAAVVESVGMLVRTGQVVGIGIACTWAPGTVLSDHVGTLLRSVLSEWEDDAPA